MGETQSKGIGPQEIVDRVTFRWGTGVMPTSGNFYESQIPGDT